MDSPASHDIMLGARIWEIIKLDPMFNAFLYETETMFPYDSVVYSSLADEKFSLE